MSNRPEILIQVEDALREESIHLFLLREYVFRFVQEEHTAADNLSVRNDVLNGQIKIDGLHKKLILNKDIDIAFRIEADRLCDQCFSLNELSRDMINLLKEDYDSTQKSENKKIVEAKKTPIDYAAKISSFFGLPGLLMTVVDKLGGSKTQVGEAAGAGFAITGISLYRDIKNDPNLKGFASRMPVIIRGGSKKIYYSMPLINTRLSAILAYHSGAEVVGKRMAGVSRRTGRLISKISGKNSPKP